MSWEGADAAIRARFAANWTTTPILYQNEAVDRPSGTDGSALPFVYLEVIGGKDEQASIGAPGSNIFRRSGMIFAHLFVPIGSGDVQALTWARQIGDLFRAQTLAITGGGFLTCEGADIGGGEKSDDDGLYWRRSVNIPFWTDDTA